MEYVLNHIVPYRDSKNDLGYIPQFRTFGSSGELADSLQGLSRSWPRVIMGFVEVR